MPTSPNRLYVLRDLHSIVLWWKAGVTLEEIVGVYRVRHNYVSGVVRAYVGQAEYERICRRHRADGTKNSGVRWHEGHASCCPKGGVSPRRAKIGEIRTFRVKARNCKSGPRRRRFIKVSHEGSRSKWIPVSQWRWEQAYGPIPEGHYVIFADGKSLHDDLDNLKLVSQVETARHALAACDREERRRKIQETTKESKRAAKLIRELHQKGKRPVHQCRDCGADVYGEKCPRCGSLVIEKYFVEMVAEYREEAGFFDMLEEEAA